MKAASQMLVLRQRQVLAFLFLLGALAPVAAAQDTTPQPAVPPSTAPQSTTPSPSASPSAAPEPAAPAGTAPQPAPASGAQIDKDASGNYTIQRFSRLVILDVIVTDGKGNIVSGLRRDDFLITENKEPQVLLNFQPPASLPSTADLPIHSTADLDRLAPHAPVNIVLLDEFNTRFEDMAFARYSLKKFLAHQPDKLPSPTMLIAVDLQHFSVLSDYTQDKAQLIQALDHHFAAYPWQMRGISWVPERFAAAFGAITRVAQATIGHPGHKNMIWIGRGFPSLSFQNLPLDTSNRVDNAVQICINELRDARVTLYSVDPAGVMVNQQAYGPDSAFNDPFGGNFTFTKLVRATGGKALFGRNDVDAEIGTGIRDGSNFYTLSYRPSNSSQDPQKFRRIAITLPEHPGLTATTREGYYLQHPPPHINPESPSRRVAYDLVNAGSSNIAYDGVPLTLSPVPNQPDTFRLHIEGRGLTWTPAHDTEPRGTEIIVMSSTFDKKGKELSRDAKQIHAKATGADIPPAGPIDRALDVVYSLAHDPKAVRARFVVRVSSTGRIGTADTALDPHALPAPAPAAPAAPHP